MSDYRVFCGLDVGKEIHHATALDTGGRRLHDAPLAELNVLVGFDDDLAAEATRLSNRIRGMLTQTHPALERVLGPRVHTNAVLALLARYGGSAGMRAAGRRQLLACATKASRRGAESLV